MQKNAGKTNITIFSPANNVAAVCEFTVLQHVEGLVLSEDAIGLRGIGSIDTLYATINPDNASNKKVNWESSNNSICTISPQGVLIAMSIGTCVITATSIDGGYTAECVVTVTQPVEEVKLSKDIYELKIGETLALDPTILPYDANNKGLIWSSSDSSIACVNENGIVNALKFGETYVRVTSVDNSTATDSCLVVVVQPVTGVSLNYTSYTLKGLGTNIQLIATVVPDNASNTEVNWKSSNESVCIVSNGIVVGVGYGTAVIIATTTDGEYMATCVITVENNTAIETISANKMLYKIYSLQGQELSVLRKGMNVIRFADGNIKKVYIK